MHYLAPKMGTTSVFIKTPMHWGNEDCWKRLPNEARRAENRDRRRYGPCISRGGDSKPHQLGGLAVM